MSRKIINVRKHIRKSKTGKRVSVRTHQRRSRDKAVIALKQKTCAQRVRGAFESRMKDIRTLWNAEDQTTEELGSLNEYGLCIDTVEPGTFTDQRELYYRYQLSWGGPSEEFRVFQNGDVEFWFLDWGDGAKVKVTGEDAETIKEIVKMGIPDAKIYE